MEIALFIVIVIFLTIIAWRLFATPRPQQDNQATTNLQNEMHLGQTLLQTELGALRTTLDTRLDDSKNTVIGSMKIMSDINSEIAKMREDQKQLVTLTGQMKELNDVLTNTKTRGELGEYRLEMLLKNVLSPGEYQLQYQFKDNTKVDAVIFYDNYLIPVDSKFSFENYNRFVKAASDEERKPFESALKNDLKIRIDETAKYIKIAENTANFAFMFIPSEALYYDLLANNVGSAAAERDLIQYASEKRVYPVSPTMFYAYLQIAQQGLRQIKINKYTEVIQKNVGILQEHLVRYKEYFDKIGSHLAITTNAYKTADDEFGKINKDIVRIAGTEKEALPEAKEG
jgi:DNA recombination protein RmuC